MKFVKLIIALLSMCINSYGQTNIQVIIKNFSSQKIDKVDAFDVSQQEILELPYNDTVNFKFNKKNIDWYWIRYHSGGNIYSKQIWLDIGLIKIYAHTDSSKLIIDTVLNSPTYYGHLKYLDAYKALYKKNDTTAMSKMLLEKFENNINDPYSLWFADTYIRLNQNSKNKLYELQALIDKQGDKFNWFSFYPSVVERLNSSLKATSISIDNYSFIGRQKKKTKLYLSNKKYYILDFWYLGCAPCRRDHKEISTSLKILENKNAEIISISTDSDKKTKEWKAYLKQNNFNWQNLLVNNKKLTKDLSVSSFPTYVIIDDFGKVKVFQNKFSEVLKWLDNQ